MASTRRVAVSCALVVLMSAHVTSFSVARLLGAFGKPSNAASPPSTFEWHTSTHDLSGRFRREDTHYVTLVTGEGEENLVLELKEDTDLLKRLKVSVFLSTRHPQPKCARQDKAEFVTRMLSITQRNVGLVRAYFAARHSAN